MDGAENVRPTASPREVLEQALDLFIKKDLNSFADMFAEDGTHELPFAPPGVPKYLCGREEIRKYLTSVVDAPLEIRAFNDLTVHETADPEVVLVEYVAEGVVVSKGTTYNMTYIQMLRARDGRIVTWRDYWSPLAGMQVLGVRGMVSAVYKTRRGQRKLRKAEKAG